MSSALRSRWQLLVEGDTDSRFFQACCRRARLGQVTVGPPYQFATGVGGGKGNALSLLPDLLQQMEDGRVSGLGLIVDADFAATLGLGFAATLRKVEDILQAAQYQLQEQAGLPGFIFSHADGLPDVGLWIMPGHGQDGYLEDFIAQSIRTEELSLFQRAVSSVGALPQPKFKPQHRTKAEVATWMAWQEAPGQTLPAAVNKDLLDWEQGPGAQFLAWLQRVFAAAT